MTTFVALAALVSTTSANWLTELMYNQADPYMPYPGHFEIPLETRARNNDHVLPGMSSLLLEASAAQNKHVLAIDDINYKTPHGNFARNRDGSDGNDTYIEKNLNLFFDIQIYANMYIGSNKQEFPMIFDSGSSWVWVGSDLCGNCANPHKFKTQESETFNQLSPFLSELNYGMGTVVGYDTTETICLTKNSKEGHGCMKDFKMKTVIHQKDLGGLHGAGLIGLAPSTQSAGSQLFVPSLYEAGAIKSNVFAMYVDNGSKIQIGGYDSKKYASEPVQFHKLDNHMFWSMKLGEVTIDGEVWPTKIKKVMADTGTSLNLLPDEDFIPIMKKYVYSQGMKCWKMPNTLTACHCTEEQHKKVPDIKFMVDEQQIVIPRDMWFEKINNTCVAKVMHHPGSDMWTLGLNFYNYYYTVFDYGNMSIGFAKSNHFGRKIHNGFVEKEVQNAGYTLL